MDDERTDVPQGTWQEGAVPSGVLSIGRLVGAAVDIVPVSSLHPADSPRLAGEDESHVEVLASSGSPLPPILVHRETMRVIDGMHRLRVARLRGDKTIAVRFFEGDDDVVFPLAVAANIAHGLPLSLADRRAAARRIMRAHSEWSDRVIAEATGLAAKTVRGIRRCATADLPGSDTRLGRDGRVRPLSAAEGRRVAGEIFAARPDASLREVARLAGISTGTARDVRMRISRGASPVQRERDGPPAPTRAPRDKFTVLRHLRSDPSLRLSNTGRDLLRWLHGKAVDRQEWSDLVRAVPGHCVRVVADLARAYAEEWERFADELEQGSGDRPEVQ